MNSTPPTARLSTSFVFGAVCPTYWPTRSSLVTDTTWPRDREPVQQRRHAQRHGRLAGPGVAGEAHVQARRLRRQAETRADPVHEQQSRDLPDAGLDRDKAHQLTIERIEDRAHRSYVPFMRKIY